MKQRANYSALSHEALKSLLALDKTLLDSPISRKIVNLIKIRVSQMNGCIYCVDFHTKEAKVAGERELRLIHLPLWHESSLFDDRERAALRWAEALTKPGHEGINDEEYAVAAATFNEKELSDLVFIVGSINFWNRLGIAFRPKPGGMDKLFGLDKLGLE